MTVRARFTQADIVRIMKSARAAGVTSYRIKITPEDTIEISVPGPDGDQPTIGDSWDDDDI